MRTFFHATKLKIRILHYDFDQVLLRARGVGAGPVLRPKEADPLRRRERQERYSGQPGPRGFGGMGLYTGWPVIHGRAFLVPCKKRLVQYTRVHWHHFLHGHVYLVRLLFSNIPLYYNILFPRIWNLAVGCSVSRSWRQAMTPRLQA